MVVPNRDRPRKEGLKKMKLIKIILDFDFETCDNGVLD
jgi:hypothetical protein